MSRLGKNSSLHFRDCPKCAQPDVRPGIVVKEENVIHVSVGGNSANVLSQNVQSFLASLVMCAEDEARV